MNTFELSTPTKTILGEIENPKLKQADVAKTISIVLFNGQHGEVNWRAVNNAIVTRWSTSARERVLKLAWKIAEAEYEKARVTK